MYVTFENLPENARVWVYQAERALTSTEKEFVLNTGQEFIDQWVTHGQPLIASLQVLDDHFVIMAVDDRQLPSGCSIDSSVDFMRNLTIELGVDFFGRTNVPLQDDGKVKVMGLAELKKQIGNGDVSDETLVYNSLAKTKGELKDWIVPLKDSWLARYLPQQQEK
jgi:hypothetical protein